MDNNNQMEIVDDIITFFKRLGATDELSDRNFDNAEVMTEEYCNYILEIAKKYDLYDEVEEAKDVNYIFNLEDTISDYFKEELITAFNIE